VGIHYYGRGIAMDMINRLHVKERLDVLSKWLQMGSCLSMGSMMGGYYPPELMQHFYQAVEDYEESLQKLREKTSR
jgi:hypothetical protein